MNRTDYTYRAAPAVARATRQYPQELPVWGVLARIVSSTAASGIYRWKYEWEEAQVSATPTYGVAAKANGLKGYAMSISEIGNANGVVAFGVTTANIPAGFAPVKIPNGTAVWVVPHRCADGELLWLIMNTQAIDGTCQ